MQSDEIKEGMEVLFRKRTLWHRAIVRAVYDKPHAVKIQDRNSLEFRVLQPHELMGIDERDNVARPVKRRVKKDKQLPLFFGIVLLVLLSGCELPRAGQNFNPSNPYQWVP